MVAGKVERKLTDIAALGPFDLVLVDPPYADVGTAVLLVAKLARLGAFTDEVVISLEHSSRDEPSAPGLTRTDLRRYGDTSLSFFCLSPGAEESPR